MIQIFKEHDETHPIRTIEYEFPDEKEFQTLSLVDVYEKIQAKEDAFGDEKEDFNSSMYVYLAEGDIWVNCGLTPPQSNIKLWLKDFKQKVIKVKFKSETLRKRPYEEIADLEDEFPKEGTKLRPKRFKTIKGVIEAVIAWKKLKKGVKNSKGEVVKFSPSEAAEILGCSYKTLYDYMFFLKKGRDCKFDFNLNQDEKMIVLRNYIKMYEKNRKARFSISALSNDVGNNETLKSAIEKLNMSIQGGKS